MSRDAYTKIGIWAIILICFVVTTACRTEESGLIQPSAVNGVLDLKNWDFEENGPVKLDGEWEFYWKQLLQPQDFVGTHPIHAVNYFSIPDIWNGHEIEGQMLSGEGYATFRLIIKIDPKSDIFAVKALEMAHAYQMWINSKVVLSNGIVGTSRETMEPEYLPKSALIQPDKGTIELLLQISNFTHKRGGPWNPFEFGTVDQINQIRERNVTIEFILFGSIFIMGFYHLGLFIIRKKERSALYFGAFCLLVSLRIVLTGERIMHAHVPWLGWEILVQLEYLAFYLAAPIFLLFLGSLFQDYSQIPIRIATAVSLAFSAVVAVTHPAVFSYTLAYYQKFLLVCSVFVLIIIFRAVFDKKEGSILIVLGSLFLLTTLVHDILLANGLIYGLNLSPLGVLIFIFIQSVMLSIRFSKAFTLAEVLSTKLEEKVALRTEHLRKANREIRLSSKKLQETQSQLIQSQKMEAMGTLAGGIAHDFNNILGTIMGYTELLLNDRLPESPEKQYLESIYASGQRAADLIKQILTFSRTNTRERIPLKIQKPIKEFLDMLRVTLSESIEIKERIDPDCGPILANQTQILQIVVNLCTNAEHAMKHEGGVLEIALSEVSILKGDHIENPDADGLYLRLSVSDTGEGITDVIKDRIFDPFFTTKEVNEGSGLGLSIIHGIIQNHEGFITFESKHHQGSRFSLFFPIIEESTVGVPNIKTEPKKGKGHILIAEDDRELALFYSTTLEKLGYVTTVAYNGQEVLERYNSQPEIFNLIFLDQGMPQKTGLDLSREILKLNPDIPIILASGHNPGLIEVEAKELGIPCILFKPIRISDLAQKIWELI